MLNEKSAKMQSDDEVEPLQSSNLSSGAATKLRLDKSANQTKSVSTNITD